MKDLRTGALLPDRIERVDDIAWATDNQTIFYVTEDAVTKRHDRFWRHLAGTDNSELVYDEKDELFDLHSPAVARQGRHPARSRRQDVHEVRYLPADRADRRPEIIAPRQPDHEYDVDHRGGLWYIRTNKDAKNFRIVTAPAGDPRRTTGPSSSPIARP